MSQVIQVIQKTQESHEKRLMAAFTKLLRLKTQESQKIVGILGESNLIQYINFKELIQLIKESNEPQKFQMIQLLKEDYLRQKTANNNVRFHFPILKIGDPLSFEYFKLELFIQEYIKQSKGLENLSKQIQKEAQKPQDESQKTKKLTEYKIQLKNQVIQIPQCIQQEQQEIQSQFSSDINQKSDKQKENFEQKCDEQFEQEDMSRQPKVPQFYYRHNGVCRLSTKRLLSVEISPLFLNEINQVKQLIKKQFSQEDEYVAEKYRIYCENFLQFYHIREGKCQSNSQNYIKEMNKFFDYYTNQYLSSNNTKIKYCYPEFQSPLIKYWRQMQQKLSKFSYPSFSKRYEILEKTLKFIHLFYTPCHQKEEFYGITNATTIFINITRTKEAIINDFEIYKNELFKSYFALCLYHQTTHCFARNLQGVQITNSNKSLTLYNNTIGCKILKFAIKKADLIQKYLHKSNIIQDTSPVKQENLKQIQRQILSIYQFLSQSSKVKEKFNQNIEIIQNAKDKLRAINFVRYYMKILGLSTPLLQSLWPEAIKYMNQQIEIKNEGEQCNSKLYPQKQLEYKFFIAILMASQDLRLFVSNKSHKKQSLKLDEKRKFYFINENSVIESFIKQIKFKKPTFFNTKRVLTFTNFVLENNEPFKQNLSNDLKQIVNKFNQVQLQLQSYFDGLQKFEHLYQINSNFLEIYNKGSTLKQPPRIKKIFQFEQSYISLFNILKFSEIYMIASQLPDFLLSKARKKFESGFDIEQRLFPNLSKRDMIYAKDYKIIKNLTNQNASEVGVAPSNQQQRKKCLYTGRGSKGFNDYPCISLKGRVCGHQSIIYDEKEQVRSNDSAADFDSSSDSSKKSAFEDKQMVRQKIEE